MYYFFGTSYEYKNYTVKGDIYITICQQSVGEVFLFKLIKFTKGCIDLEFCYVYLFEKDNKRSWSLLFFLSGNQGVEIFMFKIF